MNITWKAEYCTGIELIDTQHQHLVFLLNNYFADQPRLDISSATSWQMLQEFNGYADDHFATEERFAHQAGIEQSGVWILHKGSHDYYINRLREFRQELETESPRAVEKLMAFLSYWWVAHITGEDQELANLLTSYLVT